MRVKVDSADRKRCLLPVICLVCFGQAEPTNSSVSLLPHYAAYRGRVRTLTLTDQGRQRYVDISIYDQTAMLLWRKGIPLSPYVCLGQHLASSLKAREFRPLSSLVRFSDPAEVDGSLRAGVFAASVTPMKAPLAPSWYTMAW